ncbi:MAG: hypothetical protein RI945_175, partial [Candidatus Parcubacteria bacterium]
MSVYILFLLAVVFFVTAFLIVEFRMRYLIRYPKYYDKDYDGHTLFLDVFFATIRYFLRRVNVYLKLVYQSLLHFWVLFISFINSILEKLYQRSRDQFMKEVVKDKKAVPYFWNHLKKYKKEKDEEARIDDNSINTIVK